LSTNDFVLSCKNSNCKKFISKEYYDIQKIEFTNNELRKLSKNIKTNPEILKNLRYNERKVT
jgi:hypothetical protein